MLHHSTGKWVPYVVFHPMLVVVMLNIRACLWVAGTHQHHGNRQTCIPMTRAERISIREYRPTCTYDVRTLKPQDSSYGGWVEIYVLRSLHRADGRENGTWKVSEYTWNTYMYRWTVSELLNLRHTLQTVTSFGWLYPLAFTYRCTVGQVRNNHIAGLLVTKTLLHLQPLSMFLSTAYKIST